MPSKEERPAAAERFEGKALLKDLSVGPRRPSTSESAALEGFAARLTQCSGEGLLWLAARAIKNLASDIAAGCPRSLGWLYGDGRCGCFGGRRVVY